MAAKRQILERLAQEQGQSILEFVLMLPLVLGMTTILVRVNTAIQISIVNQQYARAQTLFLAQNSSIYPRLALQPKLLKAGTNQMVVGVSDNSPDQEEDTVNYSPSASTQLITRKPAKGTGASDNPQEEPESRAKVRIRNTVSLCTQSIVIQGANGLGPLTALSLGEGFPAKNFYFCGTKLSNMEPKFK